MRVVYSPAYHVDIGLHVFPTDKYRRVRDRLVETGVVSPSEFVEPQPATWEELALVHTPEYLETLRAGTMTLEDVAQLELPWSPDMVEGFRLMVGGTIEAALIACGLVHDGGTQNPQNPQNPQKASLREKNTVCELREFRVECRRSSRRRPSPCLPESRRGVLSVQRRCGGGPRAAIARHRTDRHCDRHGI